MSKEEKLGASSVDNALAANLRLGVWIPISPVRAQEVVGRLQSQRSGVKLVV